jgi:hypothetical protein
MTLADVVPFTIDVGPNVRAVLLALVPVLMLVVQGSRGKRTKEAAQEAVAQLSPNGGTSAFDKLTTQIDHVSAQVADLAATVESNSSRLDVLDVIEAERRAAAKRGGLSPGG